MMHMDYASGTHKPSLQLYVVPITPVYHQYHMPQPPLIPVDTRTPQQYSLPQAQPTAYRQQKCGYQYDEWGRRGRSYYHGQVKGGGHRCGGGCNTHNWYQKYMSHQCKQ